MAPKGLSFSMVVSCKRRYYSKMEERIAALEKEIEALKERNARVEAEKAWERSGWRIGSLTLITYAIALAVLYAIGNTSPFRNALIPAIGFFLSVQTLPFLRAFWMRNRKSE